MTMHNNAGCGTAAGLSVLAVAVMALACRASAAEPAGEELVAGRMLADVKSVAPGQPFAVGVMLEIKEGWHVYWKNPGDAGLATAVKFNLPEGFSAGPLRWPKPETFKQPGDVTGYGYTGKVMLISTITPPKDLPAGSKVAISADVSWLSCKEKCVPGEKKLALELPAAASAAHDNRELFSAWQARMAPPAPDFTLTDQDGKPVRLADLRGKVVVLEWINPDCPFVKRHHVERNTMVELARKYADKGVVWLAINTTHYMDRRANKKWHDDWKLPYPILVDADGKVGRAYGAKSTPHMFIIDQAGEIAYQGAIDDDPGGKAGSPANYVDAALGELLAGRPVGNPSTNAYGCSVKYAG